MRDRLRHALLGLAAGDVLGAGFEGSRPDPGRFRDGVRPVAGSAYTDDTQQALVLALHLIRHGSVDGRSLAHEFLTLHDSADRPGVYRGTGSGFRSFLQHLAEGASPDEAAQPSAGNGAAMRVTPVAMLFPDDPARLVDEAVAAALVTHADPRGVAAAAATAAAVVGGARRVGAREYLHRAAEAAEDAEHRLFSDHIGSVAPGDVWHAMSGALRAAEPLLGAPPADVAGVVGEHAARTSASESTSGTDPYAPASVVTALVVAADLDTEPVEVVGSLVALGGDTDTMAAIAGAVAGARWGIDSWPWEIPNGALIASVAEALVTGTRPDPWPDLYSIEASLT